MNIRQARRRRSKAGLIIGVAIAALTATSGQAGTLVGSTVTYQSFFPAQGSILSSLGTQTVANATRFDDPVGGITSYFAGDQLIIRNNEALAFAATAFNGPQFVFGTGGLTGATIDPASSSDLLGAVASTSDSVQANFSALSPALGSSLIVDLASGTPLQGQPLTYNYLLPGAGNVAESLGTAPLVDTTSFLDDNDGILVSIGAKTITVVNLEPLAFAAGAFNGPDLTFSGVHITGAQIDPTSSADFLGALRKTSDSVSINFSGLAPAAGHSLVIDISAVSAVPEPANWAAMLLGFGMAGAMIRRRRASAAALPS
jgi:hypothetical protein